MFINKSTSEQLDPSLVLEAAVTSDGIKEKVSKIP